MPTLREMVEAAKAKKTTPIVAPPVQPQLEPQLVTEIAKAKPIVPMQTAQGGSVLNRLRATPQAPPKDEPTILPLDLVKAEEPLQFIVGPVVPSEGPVTDLAKLRENLKFLAENIEQKDLVGQVVRTIAVQLKSNPAIAEGMIDSDFDLVVRGLRKAYMIAARNKTEKRVKTAAKNSELDEINNMFKAAGVNLDF